MRNYEIRGCSGYVVVGKQGHLVNLLKAEPYGAGRSRKPLFEKKKSWLQCWNIITFFLNLHFQAKRDKKKQWDTFYINVHSDVLGDTFGDPWWKLQPILIKLGIIDKNPSFEEGSFPQSYRLHKDIIHSKHLYIEDLSNKNLDRTFNSRVTLDVDRLLEDFEDIAETRSKKPRKKKWSPFDKIMLIKTIKEFNYHDNPQQVSTGREFNKANRLPEEFRDYLYIDDEETTEIDIKSSLPSVLYKYAEGEEKRRYGELIEQGQLYEFFASNLGIPTRRHTTKKAFVYYLGGYREYLCESLGSVLRKHFPMLHQWIELTEADYLIQNPNGKGGQVSRILQKTESKIIVKMMEQINTDEILTVSIHDGVRVKTQHAEIIEKAIRHAFKLQVGITPVLTVEEHDLCDNRSEMERLFEEAVINTHMLEWDQQDWE